MSCVLNIFYHHTSHHWCVTLHAPITFVLFVSMYLPVGFRILVVSKHRYSYFPTNVHIYDDMYLYIRIYIYLCYHIHFYTFIHNYMYYIYIYIFIYFYIYTDIYICLYLHISYNLWFHLTICFFGELIVVGFKLASLRS